AEALVERKLQRVVAGEAGRFILRDAGECRSVNTALIHVGQGCRRTIDCRVEFALQRLMCALRADVACRQYDVLYRLLLHVEIPLLDVGVGQAGVQRFTDGRRQSEGKVAAFVRRGRGFVRERIDAAMIRVGEAERLVDLQLQREGLRVGERRELV